MFDIQTDVSDLDIEGTRVDVYRNLNDDCLSIKSRDTDSDAYGTVIAHADFVLLEDVEFVVQDAGQQRVRETGVKNVHAVCRGTIVAVGMDAEMEWNLMVRMFDNDVVNVTYNPYETDHFEVEGTPKVGEHDVDTGDPIYESTYASITTDGVGAMLPSLTN